MIHQPTILLVEDNDADAKLTVSAFRHAKITNPLIRARDGVEALDYLFGQGQYAGDISDIPAMMLLDLNLPKLDGLAVLKAIRADERTKSLSTVILLSSIHDKERLEAFEYLAASYMVKPVNYDDFVVVARQFGLEWMALGTERTLVLRPKSNPEPEHFGI